jgi:hypothetical protein
MMFMMMMVVRMVVVVKRCAVVWLVSVVSLRVCVRCSGACYVSTFITMVVVVVAEWVHIEIYAAGPFVLSVSYHHHHNLPGEGDRTRNNLGVEDTNDGCIYSHFHARLLLVARGAFGSPNKN